MRSRLDPAFLRLFSRLPRHVQERARATYQRWCDDPHHPSLDFKRVHARLPIYSVRVGIQYRAVGLKRDDDTIIWFFIGSHADYDDLLSRGL